MATLHLVRHGQASFGAANYDQLSELGREQSRVTGAFARRAGLAFDRVVCGPAMRHAQTAEAFAEGFGASPPSVVESGFAEFDHMEVLERYRPGFGDIATLASELSKQADPRRAFEGHFRAAIARWTDAKFAGDYTEPYAVFVDRCERAFARLCAGVGERDSVWVFTSGGPISAIMRRVLGLNETLTWELNSSLVNASVSTLKTRGERARLETFNSYGHLRLDESGQLVTWR